MPSSVVSHPDPSMISRENWDDAEGWTNELLCRIRPTVAADRYRREVFEYVRGVITGSFDCEVVPYGSVPFKTYLPDGDIDLTAISTPNIGSTLSSDVYAVLKGQEHNKSSNFEVKDVHFIDAEVKLVKCLVKNIVVDISFNQLGGLSKLCFLEKVDDLIGKNHLFKRSIILIKAWCYYESRILGAHHGLISTYALETLVLHVFHLFHSSLNGPLAVLYRFLDYFGKFDWENYCVSVSGPVCISSLSDVAAKVPENGRNKLLLSEEFLQDCVDKFSVPSKGIETNSRAFPQKNLNIIDALKENNNLGRSVNRGNFYRIRSAFKYAASKLGQILLSPRERIADEINSFFANTLERNETVATNDERSDTSCEDSMFLKATAGDHNDKILSSRNGNKLSSMLPPKSVASNDMSFAHRPECKEKSLVASNSVGSYRNNENVAPNRLVVSIPAHNMSENSSSAVRERNSASNLGNSAPLNSLLDLSGHYERYFSILMRSQISSPALPSLVSNQLLSKNILKSTQQSPPVEPKACSEMKESGNLGTQSHPVNPPILSNASIRSEEQKKSEGIGTYFPKMKHHSNRDQPSSRRRRFPASGGHGQLRRHAHKSSLATAPTEMNLSGEVRLELSSQEEYPVLGNVKYTASDFQLHLPSVWGSLNSRDLAHTSETNESQLHQLKLSEVSVPEESSYLSLETASGRAVPMVRNPSALAGTNEERVAEPAFHLKNEVDFPPLSIKRMVKA